MNTTSNKYNEIKNAFDNLFSQLSDEDRLDNDAKLLMFRFLDIVERKCDSLGWNRKQLAERVGTSASYITQLYRGDKLLNMHTLAKLQKALDLKFQVSYTEAYEQTTKSYMPIMEEKGMWVFHPFNKPDYNANEDIPKYENEFELIA